MARAPKATISSSSVAISATAALDALGPAGAGEPVGDGCRGACVSVGDGIGAGRLALFASVAAPRRLTTAAASDEGLARASDEGLAAPTSAVLASALFSRVPWPHVLDAGAGTAALAMCAEMGRPETRMSCATSANKEKRASLKRRPWPTDSVIHLGRTTCNLTAVREVAFFNIARSFAPASCVQMTCVTPRFVKCGVTSAPWRRASLPSE
mmetsp:Transcript_97516/g.280661  ORF Transcript_97516/g.280661 Transcript_97516/m.280661 type:complete len:211 (+) Transcript_97516:826-1458(+)